MHSLLGWSKYIKKHLSFYSGANQLTAFSVALSHHPMAILSFYPTLPSSSLSFAKHPQRVLPHLAIFPPYLTPLTSPLSLFSKRIMHSPPSSRDPHVIRTSALIDPDGGALVELVAPPSDRDALRQEASTFPSVSLKQIDIEWVHVLSEGWASPLRGFMRENEYLQCLHFNSLKMEDGSVVNMSLPIVLSITDQEKEAIGGKESVALLGPSGEPVAILRRCDNLESIVICKSEEFDSN